jgi:hypothetical protein
VSLTAELVAAHLAATDGKGYGDGPGLTNCSIALEATLARVYGMRVFGEHDALMIADDEQPFSPLAAVVRLGIAEHVSEPQRGRWHVVQGWVVLPGGDGDPEGHSMLWWHPMSGNVGRVLEANKRHPWDYTAKWGERTARYTAGIRIAALLPPEVARARPSGIEQPQPRIFTAKNARKG